MTVAELIELLKTLDQERGIWIFYDYPCDALWKSPARAKQGGFMV